MIFTTLALIAIFVCLICDLAITGHFTWSLIATSSIIFAWFVIIPVILLGKKGIIIALALLTVLIIPYLYILSRIIKEPMIFTIGLPMSIIGVIYAWCVFGIFILLPNRKTKALSFTLFLAVPLNFIVNLTLSNILFEEPLIDAWDLLSALLLIILASSLLIYDYIRYNIKKHPTHRLKPFANHKPKLSP